MKKRIAILLALLFIAAPSLRAQGTGTVYHTVTLVPNGGIVPVIGNWVLRDDMSLIQIVPTGGFIMLPMVNRDDYMFLGWFSDRPDVMFNNITHDITINAYWLSPDGIIISAPTPTPTPIPTPPPEYTNGLSGQIRQIVFRATTTGLLVGFVFFFVALGINTVFTIVSKATQ